MGRKKKKQQERKSVRKTGSDGRQGGGQTPRGFYWFTGRSQNYGLGSPAQPCLPSRKLCCYKVLLSGRPLGLKRSRSGICVCVSGSGGVRLDV